MTDAFRIAALVLLAIASGGMLRFYLSQQRMPWLAFIAVTAATTSMAANLIFAINAIPDESFRIGLTPPIIVYALCIIIALRRFLTVKR